MSVREECDEKSWEVVLGSVEFHSSQSYNAWSQLGGTGS
jgi:hypothetical protein